jgi:transketolase
MAAAHYHLDNLTAILDYNKVQAKGLLYNMVGIEPVADKWRSFGWEVIEADGHDVSALMQALHVARDINVRGKPTMIVAHTVKGRGVDWMEFNYRWHTHAPTPQEADQALRGLAQRFGRPNEGYSRLAAEGTMQARVASDLGVADRPA